MVKQSDFVAELLIEPAKLQAFTQALFEGAGVHPPQAKLVSEVCFSPPAPSTRASAVLPPAGAPSDPLPRTTQLLVDNDLHGASSHGTNLPHGWRYLAQMRDGEINPNPVPKVISDEGSCRVYDGDGGIGHPVCHAAMTWAISKAKETGCAVATTRNHHHFGAAVQW